MRENARVFIFHAESFSESDSRCGKMAPEWKRLKDMAADITRREGSLAKRDRALRTRKLSDRGNTFTEIRAAATLNSWHECGEQDERERL